MAPADEPNAPSPETLMAITLALMTAWASPCPYARMAPVEQRRVLARKIQSHLFFLRLHPGLNAEFRQVVTQIQPYWESLADPAASPQNDVTSHQPGRLH